ncbi:hypothetical protein BX600DRAFT_443170 [Xylariales sp. PMI_506]|nr:hypothetical protein BX600DRAFT_443170 [Xylariales sp. PMI_506]
MSDSHEPDTADQRQQLLSNGADESFQQDSQYSDRDMKRPPPRNGNDIKSPWLGICTHAAFLACALALVAPIAWLVTRASSLSDMLLTNGCLPDGTFAIPAHGTISIWNTNLFLAISLQAMGPDLWSFAHAKLVDVVWDLLVGRGLQVALTVLAFAVFSNVLLRVMEREEIPFRTYASVSFQPGGFSSIWAIIGALGPPKPDPQQDDADDTARSRSVRLPPRALHRSCHAWLLLLLMVVLTIYIAVLPTLLSAATGYVPSYYPSLTYTPPGGMLGLSLESTIPCDTSTGLAPAWGYLTDADRIAINPDYMVIPYPPYAIPYLQEYYYTYKDAYDALATDPSCIGAMNMADCPGTNITSTFKLESVVIQTLPAPLLNLHLFAPFNASSWTEYAPFTATIDNPPGAWSCGDSYFWQEDMVPQVDHSIANVSGSCTAVGSGVLGDSANTFKWGFSFHMLLLTCVLSLAALVGFYVLWLYGRGGAAGTRRARESPNVLRAAADMVGQARLYYGDEAVDGTWTANEMRRRLYKGERGMRVEVTQRDDV